MSDYFGHYSELCSVELWGVVSVQAKVEMYSKYERQKDKRSYDDRMHLFTGPQFVSPPDRIRPQVLARFCMRHPATHTHTHTHTPCVVRVRVSAPSPPWHFWSCSVLFCSLALLDPRVGHTMDVLSPLIPVLCHSD